MISSQRWWLSIPFVGALAVLAYLVWGASLAMTYPYDGLYIYDLAGNIEIEPDSPAVGVLHPGDIVKSIDDVPINEIHPYYPGKRAGDAVTFEVERAGRLIQVSFTLSESSALERFYRLAPLFIALIFWAIGVGVQTFKPAQEASQVFFFFFQLTAATLGSGVTSQFGPVWTVQLLRFLLWACGPLIVHFHFHFPQAFKVPRQKFFLSGLYLLGFVMGVLYAYAGNVGLDILLANRFQYANRYFLTLCFLVVIGLLFYSYRNATTAGVRSKIRIVVLGGVISLLPLLVLGILPNALLGETFVPQAVLFLFLGILPLTYGFAMFRYRLIEIERHVNRGATIIIVYSTLGVFYLFFSVGLDRLLPAITFKGPVINTVLVLILATVFSPLNRFVQRLVDTIFYGGWYDYRSAVSVITQGLEQITELDMLAETTCRRLVDTIRLEEACVFLADLEGDFSVIAVAPPPAGREKSRASYAPMPRSSLSYLLNVGGAVERSVLREALSQATLSPAEHNLLNSEQAYLWVPIIGHGNVLGLMALGPKLGGDIFGGEDTDILRVVARHLAPLIENIHLVTRLRQHNAMLEQRVAERTEELSASKKRLEAILESVGEGVVVTDLDATFLTVNATYEKQTGYSAIELSGCKMWDLYDLEDPDAFHDEIRNMTRLGSVWTRDSVGLRKNGTRYDVQITMAPLRDENWNIIGYVGSQRDITHHKELDRLKDLFVSDVSHELRTPTTNISLYLDLLENAGPEKRTHYLDVLKDQSHLLMKLVEDILDLSRLAVRKDKHLEFTLIDLNQLVNQVVTAIYPLADATGLDLIFEPEPDLPNIQGEPNQISRLVTNLVANAIHYTPRGFVVVRTKHADGSVILDVQDSGIGIDVEDQQHIFERFYRGRLVRQSKIHGTGLGLAIVKEIADMHDGVIEVQSEAGKGSTFSVNFPVTVGEEWLVRQSLL